MVRKLVTLIAVAYTICFATELLISVGLTEDRLEPLFERNLEIVTELENWALVLIDDTELSELTDYAFQVLDENPKKGEYYLIRLLNTKIDLNKYGKILFSDDLDYLIRIDEKMLEDLIREQIMIMRLRLEPMIRSDNQSPKFMQDPIIEEIVDLVEPDSILGFVQRLQDFVSRYSTYDSCFAAADYIASKFIDYGCDSVYLQHHTTRHASNVIGVKRGVIYPDSIYAVVCGHFDATSDQAPPIAPGADDNGSGTSSVIEAARVMKDYLFEYSVRYIAFSGEEFGLYGSQYYAALARSQGDSILGVLNADMIGYVDALPESVEVIGKISNPACGPFVDFFIAVADTYTTLLTRKRMTNNWLPSDNQSFLEQGYIAILNIEDYWPNNPHYHLASDTIGAGYNNNDFCTEVTKAQVAALSIMAVPYAPGIEEGITTIDPRIPVLRIYPSVSSAFLTIVFEGLSSKANLKIYNASGILVKSFKQMSVHNRTQMAGEVFWDTKDDSGRQVPAGIYFVCLDNEDYKAAEKVTLIR